MFSKTLLHRVFIITKLPHLKCLTAAVVIRNNKCSKHGVTNQKYCQELFQRNTAGLYPYVNHSGSGLRAGVYNDMEEEEQVAETEQALPHIKDSARQMVQSSQDRKPQFWNAPTTWKEQLHNT